MLTSWSFVFKYFYTRHENLGFSYVRSPHDEFAIKKPLMGGDTFITCVTPGEGIGSMALRYVTVMTAAYKYGRRYVHTPFSNVGHQPLGYDGEEWAREWDAFLGLGAEEDQDIPARAYEWCYQEVTGGDLQQLEGVFRSKYTTIQDWR